MYLQLSPLLSLTEGYLTNAKIAKRLNCICLNMDCYCLQHIAQVVLLCLSINKAAILNIHAFNILSCQICFS